MLKSKLREGAVVPNVEIPSTGGATFSVSGYRHRRNLVIFFFRDANCGPCRTLLEEMAGSYNEYKELNSEILAVFEGDMEQARAIKSELNLPFPLLADENGKMASRYFEDDSPQPPAAVFITDRYGALYAEVLPENEFGIPPNAGILSWLLFIEIQCPE